LFCLQWRSQVFLLQDACSSCLSMLFPRGPSIIRLLVHALLFV
jgi:hypothetical protein